MQVRSARMRAAWAALALGGLLAACNGDAGDSTGNPGGGGGGGGGGGTTAGGSAKYTTVVSPQPLSTSVNADTARAVTQKIAATAGGTVVATGADGTVYTLTVPPDALDADLTVTMTPVSRFNSLPFNGSDTQAAWGVELAPAGTRFVNPLTLRIAPPAGSVPPLPTQLPFSWGEGGSKVALAPMDPNSAAIDLKLMHFSGWAIARHNLGVSASISGLRDRLGGSEAARLETAMAERLVELRREQKAGGADAGLLTAAELQAYLAEFDRLVIQPRVAAAGQSCANDKLAAETLAIASRQSQLLGLADPYGPQLMALFWPGANLCMAEEYIKCHDNHIVQDIIPAALSMMRQALLFGLESTQSYADWKARANQQIQACHVYRVDIESAARQTNAQWNYRQDMKGSVTARFNAPPLDDLGAKIIGEGPLQPTGMSVRYSDSCWSVVATAPGSAVFHVLSLVPIKAADGSLSDFRMDYGSFLDASTHTVQICGDPPRIFVNGAFTWEGTYTLAILDNPNFIDATGMPFIDRWTITQGSGAIASRTIEPVKTDSGLTFAAGPTTYKIVHIPGQ